MANRLSSGNGINGRGSGAPAQTARQILRNIGEAADRTREGIGELVEGLDDRAFKVLERGLDRAVENSETIPWWMLTDNQRKAKKFYRQLRDKVRDRNRRNGL